MRILYTILLFLALPFMLLRLFWRALRLPAYALRIGERFGWVQPSSVPGIIVHAVSVGEFVASQPLLSEIQQQYAQLPLTVTTMTPTGAQRVATTFGDKVYHCYFPYDFPFAIKRFLARRKPRCIVLMETELWPNFLAICHQQQIPVILTNARLSARSLRGYLKVKSVSQQMMRDLAKICTQTEADEERFLALGAQKPQVIIAGNLKFEQKISQSHREVAMRLRNRWGKDKLVWIAASTHEGEEEQILEVHQLLKQSLPEAILVIVPRHPERFPKVANLCKKKQWQVALRSQDDIHQNIDVLVGDSMGELLMYYASADVAFVGGSLVPVGGHNPLEAVAIGCPVLFGEYTFNFADIYRQLVSQQAALRVKDSMQLEEMVKKLLLDSVLRTQMVSHGQALMKQNQGATAKQFAVIHEVMSLQSSLSE